VEIGLLEKAHQIVIAIAETWGSLEGKLFLGEREGHGWRLLGSAREVAFGIKGLVWAKDKVEGDGKSPAGIFRLGPVYGKGSRKGKGKMQMDYFPITPGMEAVDDPKSLYYNHIVERSLVPHPDWHSSEKLQEIDLYDLMVVIQHNWPNPIPNRGSAIFMHRWREMREGTAGCIALDSSDLQSIVQWLDPRASPVLVLMPRKEASDLLSLSLIK